jgi:hypothetical protein
VTARSGADTSKSASLSILVRPKETLVGTDSNANGVRDSVEAFINNKSLPVDLKTKSLDLAVTLQAVLAAPGDVNTDNLLAAALIQKIKAVNVANGQPTTLVNELLAQTIDTPERMTAYLRMENNINTAMFSYQLAYMENQRLQTNPIAQAAVQPGYMLIYINGIDNSLAEASDSIVSLWKAIKDVNGNFNGQPLNEGPLYNKSYGPLKDLVEVYYQWSQQNSSTKNRLSFFWQVLYGLPIPPGFELLKTAIEPLLTTSIKSSVNKALDEARPNDVLIDMENKVRSFLNAGYKTLLVAHSQGSLFAVDLYNRIAPTLSRQSLGAVLVANMSSVPLPVPYVTADCDGVVIDARFAHSGIPGANVDVNWARALLADSRGHSFQNIYLNTDIAAWPKVKTTIESELAKLVDPISTITVSVSPSSWTMNTGEQKQFAATVFGSTNTAVTWSVEESSGGPITAGGLYTAPGTAGTYHVRATSQQDTSKYGRATVTVNPPILGLVGYWKFDEGSGSLAADSSGTGNLATLIGNPTWASGKSGGAISLNGNNQYAFVGNNQSINITNKLSISIWWNGTFESNNDWPMFVSKGGFDIGTGYEIGFSSNHFGTPGLLHMSSGGSGIVTNIPVLTQNQWHHIVGVIDGNQGKLYLNGNMILQGVVNNLSNNNDDFNIGRRTPGNSWAGYVNGKIDEVRLYNTALTANEINNLYLSTK